MNAATRTAILNFQHDKNLESTGALNWRTAQALGIITGGVNQAPQDMFTSVESIRFAQATLRDRGYYTGPINGVMNLATREATRQFQQENNLPTTGYLDARTGRLLGLASESGEEAKPIEIRNPNAERLGRNSIRISSDVLTQGGGWQVFVNRFVTGNTLHVNIRGVPPRYSTGTATDHHPFTETYDNLPNVTRVIIHGPQRDFTFNLLGNNIPTPGGTGGAANIGNPRQIAFLANRLLQDYQRDLNIRSNRGQLVYDTRRDFSTNEVDVLSQISSLQAAADVYNQLTTTVTDSEAVKGAADALLRQARVLDRLMRRYTQLTISPSVRRSWDQLQAELARINVTDVNLESEIIR
jgi:peptidoglycan hydrolase-like protein with peptidoglycan-binding domain